MYRTCHNKCQLKVTILRERHLWRLSSERRHQSAERDPAEKERHRAPDGGGALVLTLSHATWVKNSPQSAMFSVQNRDFLILLCFGVEKSQTMCDESPVLAQNRDF